MTVLAEKLATRKDLVNMIGRLDDALAAAMVYEKSEYPDKAKEAKEKAEDSVLTIEKQLASALDALQEIENLIRGANTRNSIVFDKQTMTISEAIVLRDRLKTEYNVRKLVADNVEGATVRSDYRYDRRKKDEVEMGSVAEPMALRDKADAVARRIRELDNELQKANWSIEV